MRLKMILVMRFEKNFYLLREECEQFVCSLSFHQSSRNSDFGLFEGEGLIAVQDDAADTEVCAPQVNGEVYSLRRTVLATVNGKLH